jgi:uncharacterized Zn finger protein (UPF0148 family)
MEGLIMATQKCPKCGMELPEGGMGKICPRCVMDVIMRQETDTEEHQVLEDAETTGQTVQVERGVALAGINMEMPGEMIGPYKLLQVLSEGELVEALSTSLTGAHLKSSYRELALCVLI